MSAVASAAPPTSEHYKSATTHQTPVSDGQQEHTGTAHNESGKSLKVEAKKEPTAQAGQGDAAQQQNTSEALWWRQLPWPPTSGWAIVYITAVYVVIAILAFFATWRQTFLTKRALTHIERPWVSIQPGQIDGTFIYEQQSPLKVSLEFMNTGRSPAFIETSIVGLRAAAIKELPKKPDYGQLEREPPILLPASGTHGTFKTVALSANDSSDVIRNKKTLILYGIAIYRDVFRRRHETRFCFLYQPPSSYQLTQFVLPGYWYFGGPKSYNRYT